MKIYNEFCYIYKIVSPSGKIYVGQTINIKSRKKNYSKANCVNQPILYNSINKYGWEKHKFEIIEECDFEDLNIAERFWQDYYDVLGEKGLNCVLTPTDELPMEVSLDTKNKISHSLNNYFSNLSKEQKSEIYGESSRKRKGKKGNRKDYSWTDKQKVKMSKRMTGNVLSNETKEKIRKKMLGRTVTWGNKISESKKGKKRNGRWGNKPISQYTKEGKLVTTYNSVTEASKKTGVKFNSISNNLNLYTQSGGGYIWKYLNLIDTLNLFLKKRWVTKHCHKSLPLIIWNYSNETQYKSVWDKIPLLLTCRALVTDLEGNVVSKGFKKFFNYSENKTEIPNKIEYIEVWEKVDGSYIGIFNYEGEWIVNSKGSFYSDQVEWANKILNNLDLNKLNKNWTYCFELVVPENRIVCDYGEERSLYFLSAFFKGEEIDDIYPKELQETIIKFPNLIQLNTFNPEKLQKKNKDNKEGFVVKFTNGERCKIKFDEYIRLHAIVTNTTSYDIWRCLKNGDSFEEILDRTPDEFNYWIKETKILILKDFYEVKYEIYEQYLHYLNVKDDKDFALKVKNNQYKPQLFALRNNKDIDSWIWSHIKPKFEKPFTRGESIKRIDITT